MDILFEDTTLFIWGIISLLKMNFSNCCRECDALWCVQFIFNEDTLWHM